MKILIKFVYLFIFFLNTQLWGWVEIKKPIGKIYFSKNVLFSGAKAAETQLFLGYSYYSKNFSSNLALCEFEKLSSKKRAEIQDLFHAKKKVYEGLLKEFDFLQRCAGENIEEIPFVFFESLIKNLALLHEFFNYYGNLKLSFENHNLLNQDILNKIKNNKEKFEITFDVCCDFIEELFVFNDELIKKNVSLPAKNIFPEERTSFIFGYLEYSLQETFPVPPDYLLVNFLKSTN